MTDFKDCFYETYRHHKENKIKGIELLDLKNGVQTVTLQEPKKSFPGLKPFHEWQAFSLASNPGFMIVRNWMSPQLLRHLTKRCLKDFTKKPHKTNLDSHVDQNLIENLWDDYAKSPKEGNLMKRLRWSTLGYHHNWDTKVYSEDLRSDFPADIADLSSIIAESLGHRNFKAEASIVNFYHKNSSLSGHVDRSEYDKSPPIISISLGCTAVFLIGGTEKSIKPTAINLKSGDIAVMSNESRLSYHAVPCILQGSYRPIREEEDDDEEEEEDEDGEGTKNLLDRISEEEWKSFEKFLKCSRININTRQVNPQKSD